jgi:hypothetical protein
MIPLAGPRPVNVNLQLAASSGKADQSPAGSSVDLSIVVPVYNEIESLPALHGMLSAALETLPQSYEIVFADDGSKDGSATALDQLAATDARIRVVHLRRNYGQTAAIMAGIQHSGGAVIITMDADGQNDPDDIAGLMAKLDEGFDVVSGWRRQREDNALSRKLPSMIANRLISILLGVPLHDYGCTLKAYRREVIEDVRLYGEMHRFIPIYAFWEGARVTELPVQHHARKFGRSKYGLGRVARVFHRSGLRPAHPILRQARPDVLRPVVPDILLGSRSEIFLRRQPDPDSAATARRNHRTVRRPVHPARPDDRGAGPHLFRVTRQGALQGEERRAASGRLVASARTRTVVAAPCAA